MDAKVTMLVESTSLTELSFALIGVIGSLGACMHGSKCRKVSCSPLHGCSCERTVPEASDSGVADEPPVLTDAPQQVAITRPA